MSISPGRWASDCVGRQVPGVGCARGKDFIAQQTRFLLEGPGHAALLINWKECAALIDDVFAQRRSHRCSVVHHHLHVSLAVVLSACLRRHGIPERQIMHWERLGWERNSQHLNGKSRGEIKDEPQGFSTSPPLAKRHSWGKNPTH